MRNILDKFVVKIRTHIMFDFFQKSCCLWDNVEECGEVRKVTKDDTLWRMRVACGISKVCSHTTGHPPTHTHTHPTTPTHTQANIIILFFICTVTLLVHMRPNFTLCAHCLSCWFIFVVNQSRKKAAVTLNQCWSENGFWTCSVHLVKAFDISGKHGR
jgi:hypothetical protein